MVNFNPLNKSLQIFPRTLNYLKLSREADSNTELLKTRWADEIMERLNIETQIKGEPTLAPGVIFLGNHMSYVDIPLLIKTIPQISFVAKKEVRSWPIIGAAAQKINTVFVDRDNKTQRLTVRESIHQVLKQGQRIALFPSGTTSLQETTRWKKGAFEIAQAGNFHIQPFRLHYTPRREVAYIDKDMLLTHLMKLSQKKSIQAVIEFHPPISVRSAEVSCLYWQKWTQEVSRENAQV